MGEFKIKDKSSPRETLRSRSNEVAVSQGKPNTEFVLFKMHNH